MKSVARRKPNVQRIKRAMRAQGITQQILADRLKRGRSTISEVMSGKKKSAFIADALAAIVGAPKHELWPHLYAPEVQP